MWKCFKYIYTSQQYKWKCKKFKQVSDLHLHKIYTPYLQLLTLTHTTLAKTCFHWRSLLLRMKGISKLGILKVNVVKIKYALHAICLHKVWHTFMESLNQHRSWLLSCGVLSNFYGGVAFWAYYLLLHHLSSPFRKLIFLLLLGSISSLNTSVHPRGFFFNFLY